MKQKFWIITDLDGNAQGYHFEDGKTVSVPSSGRKKPVDENDPKTAIAAAMGLSSTGAQDLNIKLFLVHGRPVLKLASTGQAYFRQVKVIYEYHPWLILGEQGYELTKLAEKVRNLTDDDLRKLVNLWSRASNLESESGVTWYDLYTEAQSHAHAAAELYGYRPQDWNLVKRVVVEPTYTIIKAIVEFAALGIWTRDLISEKGIYKEKDYKTLTTILRSVIGDVHS